MGVLWGGSLFRHLYVLILAMIGLLVMVEVIDRIKSIYSVSNRMKPRAYKLIYWPSSKRLLSFIDPPIVRSRDLLPEGMIFRPPRAKPKGNISPVIFHRIPRAEGL